MSTDGYELVKGAKVFLVERGHGYSEKAARVHAGTVESVVGVAASVRMKEGGGLFYWDPKVKSPFSRNEPLFARASSACTAADRLDSEELTTIAKERSELDKRMKAYKASMRAERRRKLA